MHPFPSVHLAELGIQYQTVADIESALREPPRHSGSVSFAPSTLGGSANTRFGPVQPQIAENCRKFVNDFHGLVSHSWTEHGAYLIDRPCYIIVETGVVILEDGRVIAETVYPSAGEKSASRLLGGGVNEINFEERLREAPALAPGTWAPLLSRWSNVYFHALSECLVQDSFFGLSRLTPHFSYIAPLRTRGTQELVIGQAHARVEQTDAPIVKVSRALVSSLLYTHSCMGTDFSRFIDSTKLRALADDLPLAPHAWDKLYVARLRASARRMTNENDLIIALTASGFKVVDGEGLPFDEQVRLFRNARLIVGPHGAGLTNAAFARAGATLCELRPLNRAGESPYWGASYLKLSAILGFRYCMHVSENQLDSDSWESDIPGIFDLISMLLGKGFSAPPGVISKR